MADPDTDEDLGIDLEITPWIGCSDEQRIRLFILKHYGSTGEATAIDGKIFVENLERIFKWVKDGEIELPKRSRSPHLKTVD